MWKQEPRELFAIKLTWMCLIKGNKQQATCSGQDCIHARCLTNRPLKRGLIWDQERKVVGGRFPLGLETGSSLAASIRHLLISPHPVSSVQPESSLLLRSTGSLIRKHLN
jgi:hypothetical protein